MEEPPTQVTSFPELAGTLSPCTDSWVTSLALLEQSVPGSPVLESLHQSLSALFHDKGTTVSPVCTASAATWKTPPSLQEASVNTSPGETTSTKDSTTETDSLLGHHSCNQLNGLSRPVLEGCLESAFVIIEAFSHHLRGYQEPHRPAACVGTVEHRDATTQTSGECPHMSEMLKRLHRSVQQSHESQQSLAKQMASTVEEVTGLAEEYTEWMKEGDRFAGAVQEDWSQMQLDYEAWQSMLTKCQAVMKRMKEEVKARRQEHVQHQENCEKLKLRIVGLRQELDQVNQLAKTKACLEADLRTTLQTVAAAAKNERELLLQENEALSRQLVAKEELIKLMEEQVTWVSQNKETIERERDSSRKELRELLDCREFIEQENQVCRIHLRDVEEELKACRSALRERNTQLEDLKDAHQMLRQEQEVLRQELATSRAELQCAQDTVEKFCKALLEIQKVQAQFLGLLDLLQEEAADTTQRSRPCTPARQALRGLGNSFVDSVLRAVAERDLETPGIGSETSTFTKTTTAILPKAAEVEERLVASLQELQEVADQICSLCTQHRKDAQEEVQSLQAEILQLEHQRESLESQLKADQDAYEADMAKLSKTLNLHKQNEKELHEVLCHQDEKLQQLIDQRREVMHLQEEVSQLKQALRKAETEITVLWEELRGARAPDVGWVQEKIQLSQEVGKLRELLLEKDSENAGLVPLLQEQLYQARQMLKRSKQVAAVMRQALTPIHADVADISELMHLLDLLE
ncbi:sperm-associated antigen 5 [Eublepharis macularius]|uniref:Sperm-associated antigen 5 n=1 Tax=Eublepharis macularius TaxID=481883 RepID=A0AA97LLR3_EUBMA|nr:sperm-associated antigen 5 [Eublepharis macularius]